MEVALVIILGALAPFLIALVSKVKWSSTTKQLVSWGFAIVLAVVWLILTGGLAVFSVESFLAAVPIIYALSQAVYAFFLKNVLSKIEAATDKDAVIVIPAEDPTNVIVTSNETLQVATATGVDGNVEVSAPIEIKTQNEVDG